MKRVSLADAKAHLSRLVEEAVAEEPVCITWRGKAVAQITAIDTPRKRIDAAAVRAMTGRDADAAGDGSRLYSTDAR